MMPRAAAACKRWIWPLLVTTGCAARFDPRAELPVGPSQDPGARQAYHEAKEQLDRGDFRAAEARFGDFRRRHPADPLVQSATLWQARARLALGDASGSVHLVEPLANLSASEPAADPARFLLGLALARSPRAADAARARSLLRPFATVVGGADRAELHGALSEAAARSGDPGDALAWYERFYEDARPAERSFIRERARQLAGAVSEGEAQRIYDASPRGSLAAAVVGSRLGELRRSRGDLGGAEKIADESRPARLRFGLEEPGERTEARLERPVVGLALPLSGRNRLTGERVLRGGLLAAQALPPGAETVALRVRDTESIPERASEAIEALAKEGASIVVSSPDRLEAEAEATRAEMLGIVLLEVAPDESGRGRALAFKLVRPNTARAEALAARARGSQARRIAILHPDNGYGKKMAAAFAAAVAGRVVAEQRYDERSTTFIAQAKKLAEARPDAVFVPAPATQLGLIAAQLAASNVTLLGSRRAEGATIYATADGLTPKVLGQIGRYLQGAVLAPVFYCEGTEGDLAPWVARYRNAFGDDPTAADALGFDAVRAARLAFERVSTERAPRGLGRAIASAPELGLTGPLSFGPAGLRSGVPELYVVEGEALRVLP